MSVMQSLHLATHSAAGGTSRRGWKTGGGRERGAQRVMMLKEREEAEEAVQMCSSWRLN